MKKCFLILSLFALSFMSPRANAAFFEPVQDQGIYSEVGAGAAFMQVKHVKFHPGYYAQGKVGYQTALPIRAELQLDYLRSEAKTKEFGSVDSESVKVKGHVRNWSIMTNVIYDINLDMCFVPYVGFGVGYSKSHGHFSASNALDKVCVKGHYDSVVYQAIAGVKYKVMENCTVGLDYAFADHHNQFKTQKVGLSAAFGF